MADYKRQLKPFDIIITYSYKSFVGRLIAWFTSKVGRIDDHRVDHCCLYLGDNSIIESTIGGVKAGVLKGYNSKDQRLYIARPLYLSEKIKRDIIKGCSKRVGREYSYIQLFVLAIKYIFKLKHTFDASKKAVVCSELIAELFEEAGVVLVPGVPAYEFSPAHFFKSHKLSAWRVF